MTDTRSSYTDQQTSSSEPVHATAVDTTSQGDQQVGPLDTSELTSQLEALLFVLDEPANPLSLADFLSVRVADVRTALKQLAHKLEEDRRGISLVEYASGWQLVTHERHHELVEQFVLSWDTRKLSAAALETLSIVAYTQPITRAGVASVRGVASDSAINSLLDKGLIKELGQAQSPGNPMLYGTTVRFLDHFGLKNIQALPALELFAPDEETRMLIAERLGATRAEMAEIEQRVAQEELFGQSDEDATQDPFAPKLNLGLQDTDVQAGEEGEGDPLQKIMHEALAQAVGAVEKIDFNELHFED